MAALGESVLMVVIAGFVALESVHRLRAGTTIDVRSYALVVVVAI